MEELESVRGAVVEALRDHSPEELAAMIGGVTPNTVRNFAKPGHGLRGSSRRAFEAWYRRTVVPSTYTATPQPPMQNRERAAFYAGIAVGMTKSIRQHLASAMADSEHLLAHLQGLIPADDDDQALTPPVSREKLDATVRRQLAKDAEEERPRRQKAAG